MSSITFNIDKLEKYHDKHENLIIKPTICFATMCKNEEHCIRETLESIYEYIEYWVVCDTGSTDKTCEIVTEFFREKNIPGELFHHEWIGFDVNKNKMYELCYKKTDYILHLDADDLIVGNFNFNVAVPVKDTYYLTTKRDRLTYKCIVLWKNDVRWKWCGVAHTIVKCLDKDDYEASEELVCDDVYLHSRDRGSRSEDPFKYLKDAELLKQQFFDTLYDDPDELNNRSVFYTAQSYFDSNEYELALKWYSLYTKLKDTWIEEEFESYIRISNCLIRLNRSYSDIEKNINKAIDIFDDRAEPYYIFGVYNNEQKNWEEGYRLLNTALSKDYASVTKKYLLFVQREKYGKFIKDELSVSCFWTNRLEEGKKYLLEIINDDDFKLQKERLTSNMNYFNDKL